LLAGARRDQVNGFALGSFGVGKFRICRRPACMQQQRLGAAHLLGDVAVTDGLPGLGLERGNLGGKLPDHIFDARQIVLGGFEAKFSLMAPGVQTGNTGRFFENAPALIGPSLNDFADASLVDESGRPRARSRHVRVLRDR
jgi:hypothetical protein